MDRYYIQSYMLVRACDVLSQLDRSADSVTALLCPNFFVFINLQIIMRDMEA